MDESLSIKLMKATITSYDYADGSPQEIEEYWVRSILRILVELLGTDTAMWRQITKTVVRLDFIIIRNKKILQ